jgi:hypothetical protein
MAACASGLEAIDAALCAEGAAGATVFVHPEQAKAANTVKAKYTQKVL